jgi:predicted DCC family thiol-disulfide oxidoreductase YuxK
MNSLYPLALLYDAACPVCSLEMDHLRERDTAGQLRFIDIAAPGFDAAPWGTTYAALDAELHAVGADGRVLIGMPALRAAYAAVGLGWVMAPSAWGPLGPLADAGYRIFARHRRGISRAAAPLIGALRSWRARRTHARMARCQAGACRLHEGGGSR